jgi:hypothetical protein
MGRSDGSIFSSAVRKLGRTAFYWVGLLCLVCPGIALAAVAGIPPMPDAQSARNYCFFMQCQVAGACVGEPKDNLVNCYRQCRKTNDSFCGISTGVIYPKYLILSVLYSPAGCGSAQKCTPGQVEYSSANSTGTKISIQQSFKTGATADSSMDVSAILKIGSSSTDSFTVSSSDSKSISVTKTVTDDEKLSGNLDGINHDQDHILLLLNPAITIQNVVGQTFWSLGIAGSSEDIAALTVYDLKHPDLAPGPTQTLFTAHGFNTNDFKQILNQDPFSTGSLSIDSSRFLRTSKTIQYLPPDNICNGPCTCLVYAETIKNDIQNEASQTFETQYNVDYKINTGAGYTGSSLGLTDDSSATITNQVTITHSHGNTDSASYTVNCPSTSYPSDAPTELQVYWDALYGSYMFNLVNAEVKIEAKKQGVSTPSINLHDLLQTK